MISTVKGTATAVLIPGDSKVCFRGITAWENGTGITVRVQDADGLRDLIAPLQLSTGEGSGGVLLPFGVPVDGIKVVVEAGGGEFIVYYERIK